MVWDAVGNRIRFISSTDQSNPYTFVYEPTAGIPVMMVDPSGYASQYMPLADCSWGSGQYLIENGLWIGQKAYDYVKYDISPRTGPYINGIANEIAPTMGLPAAPVEGAVIQLGVKLKSAGSRILGSIGNTLGKVGRKGAYEVAKQGGKHSPFYEQYAKKTSTEIQKGIRSLQKQIDEHLDKIRNPEKHIKDFSEIDPREQKALINKKWLSHIMRQREQQAILEGILKERGL